MGIVDSTINRNGSNPYLFIKIPKREYYQNEPIKGELLVSIREPIEIEEIEFFINCISSYQYTTGSGKNRTTHHVKEETSYFHCLFNKYDLISRFNLMPDPVQNRYFTNPGIYSFPFDYTNACSNPPSFNYEQYYRFKIEHQIKGQIKFGDYLNPTDKKKLKKPFFVLQDILIKAVPCILNWPLTQEIGKMVEIKKIFSKNIEGGYVYLSFSLDKSNFKYNEPINIFIRVDNSKGFFNIKGINILVNNTIDATHGHFINTTNKQEFNIPINSGERKEMRVVLISATNYIANEKYMYFASDFQGLFNAPNIFNDKLITCEYYIKVSVLFENKGVEKDLVSCQIPIYLSHLRVDEFQRGINDEIMQTMNIVEKGVNNAAQSCMTTTDGENKELINDFVIFEKEK